MAGMTQREREIREKRASVYDGMSAIMEKVRSENRALTDSERTEFDKREAELTTLDADLDREVKFAKREAGREETAETRGLSRDESDSVEKRHERAFSNFLRGGMEAVAPEDKSLILSTRAELDASSLKTDTSGTAKAGYTVPQGFWHNLQIALKAYGGLLDVCNVVDTSTGNQMPWPTSDPTSIVGSYITESNQLGFTDYTFGQGVLNAYTITSGVVLASLQIINDSAFNVDSFVTDRIGEAIGRKVAAELFTGTGSSAMQGIQTALVAKGAGSVGTGGLYAAPTENVHYLGDGGTATTKLAQAVPSFADILAMVTYVDPAYRAAGSCTWVCSDTTVQNVRKLTDNFGHPLWQPNVQVGGVDQLYGYPVRIDQNAGSISTVASTVGGLYFGDFKRAMVVRRVNQADVMRLTERYADYLQVGFLGFVRMDSRSNDLRAAVAYKSPAA